MWQHYVFFFILNTASICLLSPVLKTTNCHVLLNKKYIFGPENAKTGNFTLGKFLIQKNWCGQFWRFWIFNTTFWLEGKAIFFQQACFFRLSLAFPRLISITKQIIHMNTKYKIVLHENWDHLAFFKNMNPIVLRSRQRKCQQSFYLENRDFILKVFFCMLICECKSLSNIFLDITIRKLFSKRFCGLP